MSYIACDTACPGGALMTVNETMLGRMKKFLRVRLEVPTASVDQDSALGESPMGFEDLFIQTEFRRRVSDWFEDLITPFPSVTWDGSTTIGDLISDVLDRSIVPHIKKATGYRSHVLGLAETAFDDAAGGGAQSVPLADRPAVQADMNDELETSLLRNVSLDDLAGDRATILSNVTDRMVV